MTQFFSNIVENVTFVLEFLGIVAALIIVAVIFEKVIKKKNQDTTRILTTRKIAMIGMFSALSGVIMLFEIPVPFAPSFYKLDFSELPVLICGFAFGPNSLTLPSSRLALNMRYSLLRYYYTELFKIFISNICMFSLICFRLLYDLFISK